MVLNMERIGRPEDDFRERLSLEDIASICGRHSIPKPSKIEPEMSGNEKVIYYLDDTYALQFLALKEEEEDYRLLESVPDIPTPSVIAWCDLDPSLEAQYLITERCPGKRLDLLWQEVDESDRLKVLRDLGEGMGGYHTVDAKSLLTVADRLELSHRITDQTSDPLGFLNRRRARTAKRLNMIGQLLAGLELDAHSLLEKTEKHLGREPDEPLFPSGLASGEPWEEHIILERTEEGFRLSGCVDLTPIMICDGALEITVLYASILGLDRRYFGVFQEGYETYRAFPDECWERLQCLAADYHAWALASLTGDTEVVGSSVLWRGNPISEWRISRVVAHYERLCSKLGLGTPTEEAKFRAQIGPW